MPPFDAVRFAAVPPFASGTWPVPPVPNGKPVAFVSVMDDGVPSAPPLVTNDPAVPRLMASAVATPVPRPVMVPNAGVHVAAETAVVSPLALLVTVTHEVALPNVPTLELTVASVVAHDPDGFVTSPVNAGTCEQSSTPDRSPNVGWRNEITPLESIA